MSDLGVWRVLLTGVRWVAMMVVAFAVLGLVAYAFAARKWHERRSEWHRLVVKRGVGAARDKTCRAPAGTLQQKSPRWARRRCGFWRASTLVCFRGS